MDKKEVFRSNNILKVTIILSALLIFGAVQAYAVVSGQQLWAKRYNPSSYDGANAIAVDKNNNVYVTGISATDYATIKYDSAGNKIWLQKYNGPGNGWDRANAIAISSNNNVHVAGYSDGGSTGDDFAVIKYDSLGNRKWTRRYNGPGNKSDSANAIAVDSNNNVYAAGESYGGSTVFFDFAVIKYDSLGNKKWVRRYNGPGNGWDEANTIAIDNNNNVYIAGESDGSSTGSDFAVIKYDSLGNRKWIRRYNGPGNSSDSANAIAIDSNNNVYIAGYSYGSTTGSDFAVVKYDSAGNKKWVQRYNGPGDDSDGANAIAVDSNNNVYITGSSSASDSWDSDDFAVVKYDSAGNKKWVKRYNGPGDGSDSANAVAVDSYNNVYVAGESDGGSTGDDFAVIKYDWAGNKKWVKRYNGPGNGYDYAYGIAIDGNRNIYVTGGSYGGSTSGDFATIKYAP